MSHAISNGIEFPISLSVGTSCQAKCPYCSIPMLPQRLTTGKALVEACQRFMAELAPLFSSYSIRITGGEIGLISDLPTFIDFINSSSSIKTVRLYTNGLLFDCNGIDLVQKCRVLDHTVHDVTSEALIRYARDVQLQGIEHISTLIEQRKPRCFRYRMIVVDSPRFTQSQRDRLTHIGVRFVEPTGYVTGDARPSTASEVDLCHHSKWLYVYDVAHGLFFNCCEVKDPHRGTKSDSLISFLTLARQPLYPECDSCRTCADISSHRNGHAIELLRAAARESK